jgi:hypothetical protein
MRRSPWPAARGYRTGDTGRIRHGGEERRRATIRAGLEAGAEGCRRRKGGMRSGPRTRLASGRLGRSGRTVPERLSDQRMVADVPLRLRGLSPGTHGEVEPYLRQAQQPALLRNGCRLLGELDDFGGGVSIMFLFAHPTRRDDCRCCVARNAFGGLLFQGFGCSKAMRQKPCLCRPDYGRSPQAGPHTRGSRRRRLDPDARRLG